MFFLGNDDEPKYLTPPPAPTIALDLIELLLGQSNVIPVSSGPHSSSPALNLTHTQHSSITTTTSITLQHSLSILTSVRQTRNNVGTILSIRQGKDKVMELRSSGRKNMLHFHYKSGRKMIMKSASVHLADDRWHKLALMVSGKQLSVLLDCQVILRSRLHHQVTLQKGNSTTFFIGTSLEDEHNFLFKVSLV